MRLGIASGNPGKLRELSALLASLPVTLCSQAELGVTGAEETAVTFIENALLKARHLSRQAALPALADDSGLVVPALGGAPGIYSSRFAGPRATDADNNAKLFAELGNQDRTPAYYHATIVVLANADDPTPLIVSGRWEGELIRDPRGHNGFGYDPHFYLPDLGVTAAELPAGEKNRLSHRGRAMDRLLGALPEKLGLA